MTKVIFLDVDGPLIPARMYATIEGQYRCNEAGDRIGYRFDPVAVGILCKLAALTGAKFVFNTAHACRGIGLLQDAVANGIPSTHIHEHWLTVYPGNKTEESYAKEGPFIARAFAVELWLMAHPGVESYVIIDDEPIASPRLVLIDFMMGFTVKTYEQTLGLLMGPMVEAEIQEANPLAVKSLATMEPAGKA